MIIMTLNRHDDDESLRPAITAEVGEHFREAIYPICVCRDVRFLVGHCETEILERTDVEQDSVCLEHFVSQSVIHNVHLFIENLDLIVWLGGMPD
eukprot:sb/3479261/